MNNAGSVGSLVGHLDEFDRRFAQADAGVPAMIGFFRLRSLFQALRDCSFHVVVIDTSARIVVAGGDLVALGHRRVGAALELRRHRAPLFPARPLGLFWCTAQPLADAIDLLERRPRHRAPCPSGSALHWTKESYQPK